MPLDRAGCWVENLRMEKGGGAERLGGRLHGVVLV